MRSNIFALLLFGALGLSATTAAAQSANASVTAEVQTPITVTKTRDLSFGLVFPGVNKTVAVADATSATFSVAGEPDTDVHISFTLPATLSDGGSNTLTITSWTGRHNTTNSAASGSDFTPSPSTVTATLDESTGNLYVFVGATVQPTSTQAAGTYTGTVTMTVVYF